MKQELQDKLVEILTSVQNATAKASDFALTQLPDIAQSYVAYGRVATLIELTAWLVAVAVCGVLVRRFWSKPWYSSYSWDEGKNVRAESNWMAMALLGLVGLVSGVCALCAATSAALVWIAPKVWLLKELAHMVG